MCQEECSQAPDSGDRNNSGTNVRCLGNQCICRLNTYGGAQTTWLAPNSLRCFAFTAVDKEQYLEIQVLRNESLLSNDTLSSYVLPGKILAYLRTGTGAESRLRLPSAKAHDYKIALTPTRPAGSLHLSRTDWRKTIARRDDGEWVGTWSMCFKATGDPITGFANSSSTPLQILVTLAQCAIGLHQRECSGHGQCIDGWGPCPPPISDHKCKKPQCACAPGTSGEVCHKGQPFAPPVEVAVVSPPRQPSGSPKPTPLPPSPPPSPPPLKAASRRSPPPRVLPPIHLLSPPLDPPQPLNPPTSTHDIPKLVLLTPSSPSPPPPMPTGTGGTGITLHGSSPPSPEHAAVDALVGPHGADGLAGRHGGDDADVETLEDEHYGVQHGDDWYHEKSQIQRDAQVVLDPWRSDNSNLEAQSIEASRYKQSIQNLGAAFLLLIL
ncbi:hypothetical protein CYMTET_27929, partial [Cymbomonas tetramitiformis]